MRVLRAMPRKQCLGRLISEGAVSQRECPTGRNMPKTRDRPTVVFFGCTKVFDLWGLSFRRADLHPLWEVGGIAPSLRRKQGRRVQWRLGEWE